MDTGYMLVGILVMSAVTYLIRALPIALVRRRLQSRFLLSLLYYLPYGVLSAMIFPAVFTCTGNVLAAEIGTGTAILLSFFFPNLLLVAIVAVLAVLVAM